MSPRIVKWIYSYTAVVKPILLYGVTLWWTALHKQCIQTPLNKVQRMAALCISGALRTTPNEALNAIWNLPSLDLAGMEKSKSAAIRLRDTGQWKPNFMAMLRFSSMINRFRRKRIYANPLSTNTPPLRP